MPSFDVVSEANISEIDNALNHARTEIRQRFDFKGTNAAILFDGEVLTLETNSKENLKSLTEVVHQKLIKRGVSLNFFEFKDEEPAGGQRIRQKAILRKGIEKEKAKEINAAIKESKLKVQPQIQGEQIRVTGKQIDDLQTLIHYLKKKDFGISLEFTNFRK